MCWAPVVEAALAGIKLSNKVPLACSNARSVSSAMNAAEKTVSGGIAMWVPKVTGTPQNCFQGMGMKCLKS